MRTQTDRHSPGGEPTPRERTEVMGRNFSMGGTPLTDTKTSAGRTAVSEHTLASSTRTAVKSEPYPTSPASYVNRSQEKRDSRASPRKRTAARTDVVKEDSSC